MNPFLKVMLILGIAWLVAIVIIVITIAASVPSQPVGP
jgi:hypothetical protein